MSDPFFLSQVLNKPQNGKGKMCANSIINPCSSNMRPTSCSLCPKPSFLCLVPPYSALNPPSSGLSSPTSAQTFHPLPLVLHPLSPVLHPLYSVRHPLTSILQHQPLVLYPLPSILGPLSCYPSSALCPPSSLCPLSLVLCTLSYFSFLCQLLQPNYVSTLVSAVSQRRNLKTNLNFPLHGIKNVEHDTVGGKDFNQAANIFKKLCFHIDFTFYIYTVCIHVCMSRKCGSKNLKEKHVDKKDILTFVTIKYY